MNNNSGRIPIPINDVCPVCTDKCEKCGGKHTGKDTIYYDPNEEADGAQEPSQVRPNDGEEETVFVRCPCKGLDFEVNIKL